MFTPSDPATQAIYRSRIIIHTIREIELKFEIPDLLNIFCELLDVLNRLEMQHDMLIELLQQENDGMMPKDFIEKYASLGEYIIPAKSKRELCEKVLTHCLDFIYGYLNKLKKAIDAARKQNKQEDLILDLQILTQKISRTTRYLPKAAVFNNEDIFAKELDDEYWDTFEGSVEVRKVGDMNSLQESFKEATKRIKIVYAAAHSLQGSDNIGLINGLFSLIKLKTFKSEEIEKNAELFFSNPSEKMLETLTSLEHSIIGKLIDVIYPSVEYSKQIYIDRFYPTISTKVVDQALDKDVWKNLDYPYFGAFYPEPRPSDFDSIFKQTEDKISIRIISPFPIKPTKDLETDFYRPEGIIIHIHGGGGVSMSSGSYQLYVRQWANLTKKVIFSIEYALAPENPYPAGLDDCWQAYNWIVDYADKALGVNTRKIILAGDATGGNMALAITYLTIRGRGRVPDGLLLNYPSLNLSRDYYSPSFLEAMEDQLVPDTMMIAAKKAYASNKYWEQDPLVSPIKVPDAILRQMPPVRITTGDLDPMHDECWRMTERLKKAKRDVILVVYRGMHRGFLSLASKKLMPEAMQCVDDCAQILSEFFVDKREWKQMSGDQDKKEWKA